MSKKLKIQFWRAEKALVMQILEQEGLPERKNKGFVHIKSFPWLYKTAIELRGNCSKRDWEIVRKNFDTNFERDNYLQKAINAITEELFTEGELEVGEMCEVRDVEVGDWEKRKLIAILPAQYRARFIVEWEDCPTEHAAWTYARPISKRIEPKIEEHGQLVTYTWEEK